MAKQHWKGSILLAPVPPTLVTCGTLENPNVLTVGWTGVLATHPPMTYISLRPSRYSYPMVMEQKEFVINLPTERLAKAVDFCGVRSGRDIDKFEHCHLTPIPAETVAAPLIEECPLSLECKVVSTMEMGSHVVFMAEITSVAVDDSLIDENGRLALEKSKLLAYAHGEYFALGAKVGSFGYSVKKKTKNSKKIKK